MTSEFDHKAREWDNNPLHVERSEAIAVSMIELFPDKKLKKGLEFGAGTGLLSFLIKDHFESIILADSSPEMIKVLTEKINERQVKNMHPVLIEPHEEIPGSGYNMVFTQMVLHHVTDTDRILDDFYRVLKTGGQLAIADLYTEDGTFHSEPFAGHNGFDPAILAKSLAARGFNDLHYQTCYKVNKILQNGLQKQFPIFLLTGKKS